MEVVGFHNRRTNGVLCIDCARTSHLFDPEWQAVEMDFQEDLEDYICDGPCALPLSEVPPIQLDGMGSIEP